MKKKISQDHFPMAGIQYYFQQLVYRSRLIEWFARKKRFNGLTRIIRSCSHFMDNGSSRTILCIGRPIFEEDIAALSAHSGKFNYFVIPKTVFIKLFTLFLPELLHDHTGYHRHGFETEKTRYREFIDALFQSIAKQRAFDAVMSCNYVYSWQQEIAASCIKNRIPFFVLHKEGITAEGDYDHLVRKYTNGKFIGTRLLVYNTNIQNALLADNIQGLSPRMIEVVGVPRFDQYAHAGSGRQTLVFFSFSIEDKSAHVPMEKERFQRLKVASQRFHEEVMTFAKETPHIHVIIKTKQNQRYLNYVTQIADNCGATGLENLTLINTGNVGALIHSAMAVMGYNSSVLIEGHLANRIVMIPDFGALSRESFFQHYPDIVTRVKTARDIKTAITRNQPQDYDPAQKQKFLTNAIFKSDFNASKRTEEVLASTLSSMV